MKQWLRRLPDAERTINEHPSNWVRCYGHPDYEVDRMGNLRSWKPICGHKIKNPRYIAHWIKKSRKDQFPYFVCKLDNKELKLAKVVWESWNNRATPKGYGVVHKNGDRRDDCLNNLMLASIYDYGKLGTIKQHKRGGVAAVKKDGDVLHWYRSARDVSRHEPVCYQSVLDRCNGKIKDEFALLGHTFRWGAEIGED